MLDWRRSIANWQSRSRRACGYESWHLRHKGLGVMRVPGFPYHSTLIHYLFTGEIQPPAVGRGGTVPAAGPYEMTITKEATAPARKREIPPIHLIIR